MDIKKLDSIGIKFNNDMVHIIENAMRSYKTHNNEFNILLKGDIKRCYGEVKSVKGLEHSYTFYDDGNISISNWDTNNSSNLGNSFLIEGFVKENVIIDNPEMKKTDKMEYTPLELSDAYQVGIRFAPEMVTIIEDRIIAAKSSNRGINILIRNDVNMGLKKLPISQDTEYRYSFFDGRNKWVLDWNPKKAYNGAHKFWIEGFVKKI